MEKSAIFRFQFSNIYNFSYLEIISQKLLNESDNEKFYTKSWPHFTRLENTEIEELEINIEKKVICFCFYLAKTELINRTRSATFAWPSGRVFVYISQFEWNHKVTTKSYVSTQKIQRRFSWIYVHVATEISSWINAKEKGQKRKKAILRAAQQKHLHLTFWRCSTVWMSFSSLSEVSESVTRWGHIQPRRSIKIWGQLQSSFQHWNHFSAKKK